MENYLSKDNQRMITLLRPLRGVTRYDGMTVTVSVTGACHRSIFLTSRRPIPIGSVGGLALSLPTTTDQVGLCLVTNYLEQNSEGFSIGAYVSALTTVSRAHWGRFCQLLAHGGEDLCAEREAPRPSGSCRILSFERALAPSLQLLLRAQGIDVTELRGETDLLRTTIGQQTQILVAEHSVRSVERLKRSLRSFEPDERPSVILLSREENPIQPLQLDPVFGAFRVLHVPCSRELLLHRLIQILWSETTVQVPLPLSLSQTESVEDALCAGASSSDVKIVPHRLLRMRFDNLHHVPVGQTAQYVLAGRDRSPIKGFLLKLWNQLRHIVHKWLDDPEHRRTAWNGAG